MNPDAWKNTLQPGDEIFIDTGGPDLGTSVFIASIDYLPENVVRILTRAGERIECFVKDIH